MTEWTGKSQKLESEQTFKTPCFFTVDNDTKESFKNYCNRNGYKMNKLIENYMAQVAGL
tara:strand:+ start:191 stop:367 length:177 start_codon:yes stop_codon:yes gene_type:complete